MTPTALAAAGHRRRPRRAAAACLAPLVPGAPTVARVDLGRVAEPDEGPLPTAEVDGAVCAAAVGAAVDAGLPVVLVVHAWGADPDGSVFGLDAWGRAAKALVDASGAVPIVAVVDGPCLGGAALVVGLADVLVLTDRARLHVSTPASIERHTGVAVDDADIGSAALHQSRSGVAHHHSPTLDDALGWAADLLELLPAHHEALPPPGATHDPAERPTRSAAATVPDDVRRAYDVRTVLADVVDDGDLLELHARYAPAIVVAFARIDGRSVGLVANQPSALAGALDIESSQKAARFVRLCDSCNVPLVTFVDTPGFRPGRDQEWRGMIRHGAQLAFAYAEATVPRVCVILRKAYGGAYIVMDAKSMGNDHCLAWPNAEIAVMGAPGAVEILHRRQLDALPDAAHATRTEELLADYEATYLTPRLALARGYVDEVIDPCDTRAAIAGSLAALAAKRERVPRRRHANTPL